MPGASADCDSTACSDGAGSGSGGGELDTKGAGSAATGEDGGLAGGGENSSQALSALTAANGTSLRSVMMIPSNDVCEAFRYTDPRRNGAPRPKLV
jgi:hypothetical protein